MTTDPTIDGVPRELIEKAMLACFEAGHGITHDKLRALLDREVITDDHLRQRIAFLTSEVHARANERDAALSELAKLKSAQPQPEPVHECQKCNGRGSMPTRHAGEGETEYRARCKLYAEQPAPVAVVMPERPHCGEEDQQSMTEYEIGLGHGACEMWDKIKFLNTK